MRVRKSPGLSSIFVIIFMISQAGTGYAGLELQSDPASELFVQTPDEAVAQLEADAAERSELEEALEDDYRTPLSLATDEGTDESDAGTSEGIPEPQIIGPGPMPTEPADGDGGNWVLQTTVETNTWEVQDEEALAAYLANLQAQIDELQEQIDGWEDVIDELERQIDRRNTEIAELQTQLEAQNEMIESLEDRLDQANNQLRTINSNLQAKAQEIRAARATGQYRLLPRLIREYQGLQRRQQLKMREITNLQGELDAAIAVREEIESQIQSNQERIEELNQQIADTLAIIYELGDQINELLEQMANPPEFLITITETIHTQEWVWVPHAPTPTPTPEPTPEPTPTPEGWITPEEAGNLITIEEYNELMEQIGSGNYGNDSSVENAPENGTSSGGSENRLPDDEDGTNDGAVITDRDDGDIVPSADDSGNGNDDQGGNDNGNRGPRDPIGPESGVAEFFYQRDICYADRPECTTDRDADTEIEQYEAFIAAIEADPTREVVRIEKKEVWSTDKDGNRILEKFLVVHWASTDGSMTTEE